MRLKFAGFFVAFALVARPSYGTGIIDWRNVDVPGNNVTGEYEALSNHVGARFDEEVLPRFRKHKYRILLVPGFLAKPQMQAGRAIADLARKAGIDAPFFTEIGNYFGEQKEWMTGQSVGLDVTMADINTQQSPEVNAAWIGQWIRDSEEDVIIIAHSKGNLDTLEALIALIKEPALRRKVKGFISLQGPYWGSPVAEYIGNSSVMSAGAGLVLKFLLGGAPESLVSLRESVRKPYMEQHGQEIAEIERYIPVIALATWKDPEGGRNADSILKLTRDAMLNDKFGIPNDGLVPWKSAILPGADYIALPGADHVATVMYCHAIPFDRIKLIKTLLTMTMDRIDQRSK